MLSVLWASWYHSNFWSVGDVMKSFEKLFIVTLVPIFYAVCKLINYKGLYINSNPVLGVKATDNLTDKGQLDYCHNKGKMSIWSCNLINSKVIYLGFMVMENKGRLGNQMSVYATLYALAKYYSLQPILLTSEEVIFCPRPHRQSPRLPTTSLPDFPMLQPWGCTKYRGWNCRGVNL